MILHMKTLSAGAFLSLMPWAACLPVWGETNRLSVSGRNAFYENEAIVLQVPAAGSAAKVTFRSDAGVQRVVTVSAVAGLARLTVLPLALSPGVWTVSSGTTTGCLDIASSIKGTPFTFLNYQGWVDDRVPIWGAMMNAQTSEERVRIWRDDYGINLLQLQNGGIDIAPRTQDLLIEMGAGFTTLNTVAGQHQPSGGLFDWSMPEVVIATRRQVQHAAQVGRRRPGFQGVHYADEPGLTYGTRNPDGSFAPFNGVVPDPTTHYFGPLAVPSQFELYTRTTGKALPDVLHPQANLEAWMDFMRFRTTILGDVFARYTADVHAIDSRLIGYSQLYAWMFLSDGLYPPENVKGVDVLSTHAYIDHPLGLWYPVHEADAMRDGHWDKPLWMMPSFEGMIRLPTIYGALARKLEGLGWDRATMLTVPATKVLAHRVVPISAMLHDVIKPRDSIAVFYSRDQYFVEIAKNLKNLMQGRDYATRLVGAWIMANAAQCPAVRVVEEDLLNGIPKEHRVIVAPGLTYARPEIRAALERYVAGGGTLLIDQSATLDLRGAVKLPFAFVDWWSQTVPGNPGFENLTPGQIFERHIVANLSTFKQALAGRVAPLVQAGSPWLLASRQVADEGQYVWLVNMKHTTREELQPLSTPVTLPAATAIYDVFSRQMVPTNTFQLDLPAGDAALYALLPVKIESVTVQATPREAAIAVAATVNGATGAVSTVVPLSVTLRDPSGRVVKTFYRATRKGQYAENLPLGNAAGPGPYRIEVTELLSSRTAATDVIPIAKATEFAVAADVEVNDVAHIQRTLRENKNKPVLVLYGADAERPAADKIAKLLRKADVSATVDVARKYDVKRPNWDPRLFYTASIYTEPVDLPVPAFLIGNQTSNPLIKRIADARLTPLPLTKEYPGAGRGLVWWARSILGLDLDVVIVYADDARGEEKAVAALGETLRTGYPPTVVCTAGP